MVDVTHDPEKCLIDGCNKRATYNFEDETKAIYCVTHKDDGMIDVCSKRCEYQGCLRQPAFNFPNESIPRFCTTHKEVGMKLIKNKLCEYKECDKQANHNFPEEKEPLYCGLHKEDRMIDILGNRCEVDNCNKFTGYGWLNKTPSRCGSHKLKGMIKQTKRKCDLCKCLGTYEQCGLRYCEEHKPNNAINLGIDKCTSCGLDDILINGVCDTCDPSVIQVRQKAKENRIKDVLTVSGITFIHDKMLDGVQCGRERPDFQIDCGTHFVYVEVDENQHDSYTCECEQMRMINLIEVRGAPVRFIRYNPDIYELCKGHKTVKQDEREKILVESVLYAMNTSPQVNNCIANVLYLFYDKYNAKKNNWLKLC
jgi:hypothetical protein